MSYWLVRSKWDGEDKKAVFINNDEWINGSETKYLDVVKRVEVEDVLLLAEDLVITHYGICGENYKDGNYKPVPNAGRLYRWNWENLKNLLR